MDSAIKKAGVVGLGVMGFDIQQLGGEPLAPPKLLSAMAEAKQKFYQDEKPNPWLATYIHRLADHACD